MELALAAMHASFLRLPPAVSCVYLDSISNLEEAEDLLQGPDDILP
jgi:hypothetical protein